MCLDVSWVLDPWSCQHATLQRAGQEHVGGAASGERGALDHFGPHFWAGAIFVEESTFCGRRD